MIVAKHEETKAQIALSFSSMRNKRKEPVATSKQGGE